MTRHSGADTVSSAAAAGPHQPGNRCACNQGPLSDPRCALSFCIHSRASGLETPQMKSHSFLQIGPFYQTMLVSSFPRKFSQSLMHVHSCVHLGADHELCRFSWAGRQAFCCFDSKYSCHFVVKPIKVY